MCSLPRVTFGMIVLNGEPFLRYNLRGIYPFAHEIIVVEGAAPGAACIATAQGHSTDGTLDTLWDFKARDDPEDKLYIVTAEDDGHPNGFWTGEKHEQSQAYARRATGDYLWQVDVDEFYHPKDMQAVLTMLRDDPQITAVSFRQIAFWGGFDYLVDSWHYRYRAGIFHRLFKWGPGYRYITHRPPTVHDPQGQDVRLLKWVSGDELARRGILLYHYSFLFPKQVVGKCEYYSTAAWSVRRYSEAHKWSREVFIELQHPYRVDPFPHHLGWLERFRGDHPPQVRALRADLQAGKLHIAPRPTDDIKDLLQSPGYRLGRAALKMVGPVHYFWQGPLRPWRRRLWRFLRDPIGSAGAVKCRIAQLLEK